MDKEAKKVLRHNKLLKSKKNGYFKYIGVYTALFAFMFIVIYYYFWLNDLTLIHKGDPLRQHTKALAYYASYFRTIVKTLLSDHRLVIPQWDFSVGMGSDVVSTFSYYVLGDPVNIISILCPTKYIAYLYQALIVVRMWLAGVSFSFMCFEFKIKNKTAVLAGAVSFALSSFAIYYGIRHAYFINPLIYLPIIIIAVERIIRGKTPLLMAFIVALAELSNFYFFYMLVIFTVLYVFIRLICIYRKKIKEAFVPLMKIAAFSIVGVMIGAMLFLPIVIAFFGDDRSASENNVDLFYVLGYYTKLPATLFTGAYAGAALQVGSSVLVLPALACLYFSKEKKRTTSKILFVIGVILMSSPIFASVLNGFAYPTNRWSFAFTLLATFILTMTWNDIITADTRRLKAIAAVFAVTCVLCLVLDKSRLIRTVLPLFLLFCLIVILALRNAEKIKIKNKTVEKVALLICVISLISNGICQLIPQAENYVDRFISEEDYNNYSYPADSAVTAELKNEPEDSFFRYSGRYLKPNSTVLSRHKNTYFYWSLSNGNISETRKDLNLRENCPYKYEGFDERTALNALANVKYYYTNAPYNSSVPYGYENSGTDNLYVNSNFLPFGYTYDSYITEESYNALTSSVDKQNAMLQSVLLEKEAENVSDGEIRLDSVEKDIEIVCNSEHVTFDDNTFTVTRADSKVTILVAPQAEAETYLCMEGMYFTGTNPYDLYTDDVSVDPNNLYRQEHVEAMDDAHKDYVNRMKSYYSEPSYHLLKVYAYDTDNTLFYKSFEYFTPAYNFYTNRHNFDINLGYSESGYKKIIITFPEVGKYSFDNISVIAQPMDNYNSYIDSLKREVMQNVNYDNNVLTGSISLSENKILCLSVPFSKGWTAYVDGEEKELLKANGMYCAIELTEGEHEIELKYETPGFKLGIIISVFGIAIYLAAVYYYLVYKKKKDLQKVTESQEEKN